MDNNELEKRLTKKLQKRLRPTWCELRYDEIRNKPYLVGKKKETDEMRTLCLVTANKFMKFHELKNHIRDSGRPSITLAIHSDDSTSVFYKCQIGLKSSYIQEQIVDSQDGNLE